MADLPLYRATAAGVDAIPSTTIRFFISSTFRDFQHERDILHELVFPPLRQLCAAAGFRLQPIDLRWGVSEEAGTARQTLHICFDELARCRTLSPDCFLLVLLGQRYGSYILPPELPTALATRLLAHLDPEERRHFEAAYWLDENAVPPQYVLLGAEEPVQTDDDALRLALARAGRAAGVSASEELLFEGSATHRELQLGLLGVAPEAGPETGTLCALRTFVSDPRGPTAGDYVEQDPRRATRLRDLTAAVVARVPAGQVARYQVDWDGEHGPAWEDDVLAAAYIDLLRPKLAAVIAARTVAREAARAGGHETAALANIAFETGRLEHFVGREEPLTTIGAYLDGPGEVLLRWSPVLAARASPLCLPAWSLTSARRNLKRCCWCGTSASPLAPRARAPCSTACSPTSLLPMGTKRRQYERTSSGPAPSVGPSPGVRPSAR